MSDSRHVQGVCDRLAEVVKDTRGLEVDPLTDIAICCGQSEAFAAAIFSSTCPLEIVNGHSSHLVLLILRLLLGIVINPGDEVIVFTPMYETYGGCISLAGGVPVSFLNLPGDHVCVFLIHRRSI